MIINSACGSCSSIEQSMPRNWRANLFRRFTSCGMRRCIGASRAPHRHLLSTPKARHVVTQLHQRKAARPGAAPPPDGRAVTCVILLGQTDLGFLVEWCAEKAGLSFQRQADIDAPASDGDARAFVVPGEAVESDGRKEAEPWDLHLAELESKRRYYAGRCNFGSYQVEPPDVLR